jgi:hypothetical protein
MLDDAEPAPRDRLALGLVIGLVVMTGVALAATLNAWIDEMYTLSTTSRSLFGTLRHALHFEAQPPLYFVLLKLWRTLGESLFVARLLSVALVGTAIWLVARTWRSFGIEASPAWPALMLATNPLVVWSATEARGYALSLCLGAALTWSYLSTYAESPTVRRRLSHGVLSVVALYTQYHLGFLLAAMGAALVVARRPSLRSYAIDMVAVAALTIPLLLVLPAHANATGAGAPLSIELGMLLRWLEEIALPWNSALEALSPWPWLLRFTRWSLRALEVGALLAIAARLRRISLPVALTTSARLLAAVIAFDALFVIVAARFVDGALGAPRYLIGLVPSTTLLACAVLTAAPGIARWLGPLLFAGASAVACVVNFFPLAKDCDCKRVAAVLESKRQEGEVTLVFPGQDALPLRYHSRETGALVPVPRPTSLERYHRGAGHLHSEAEVESTLPTPRPDTVWVYTRKGGGRRFGDLGTRHLEAFLGRNYRVLERYSFAGGVELRHFATRAEQAAENASSLP